MSLTEILILFCSGLFLWFLHLHITLCDFTKKMHSLIPYFFSYGKYGTSVQAFNFTLGYKIFSLSLVLVIWLVTNKFNTKKPTNQIYEIWNVLFWKTLWVCELLVLVYCCSFHFDYGAFCVCPLHDWHIGMSLKISVYL